MCGLVGVAGVVNSAQDKVFKQLLYIDGLRGMHSTGVLFVPWLEKSPPKVLKEAVDPNFFLSRPDVQGAITRRNIMMLGHNRYATVGKIVDENAHPFSFNKVIGAHNGTLTNKSYLADSHQFTVDSENLYHSIDKIGLDETYEIMQGAWALSFWDVEEEKLNFIRNYQRPLSYTFSKDRKTLYWASEGGMLEFILDRQKPKIEYTDIVNTKPHHLYTFKIPRDGSPISDITVKDMTPKPKALPPVKKDTTSYDRSSGRYVNKYARQRREFVLGNLKKNDYNQYYFEGEFIAPPYEQVVMHVPPSCLFLKEMYGKGEILLGSVTYYNSKHDTYTISPHNIEEVDLPPICHDGYQGEQLSLPQFLERTSLGCAWCGSPVFFDDDLLWLDNRDVMCETCACSSDTKEYRNDLGVH